MNVLRLILRNLGLKIVGLVFALLLWFHVATNREYDIELSYKLAYETLPDDLVMAVRPQDEVGVRLRGSGKQLLRLWWSDRDWPIDLSRATIGETKVDLWADDVPRLGVDEVEVLGLAQTGQLSVWLDSIATRRVPVYTNEVFAVSRGHTTTGPVRLSPDSVTLTGPRSSLSGINAVPVESIGHDEWDESVSELVDIRLPSAYNLICAPTQIHVQQAVEPFATRRFDSLPVAIVMSGLEDDCTVDPSHVTIEIGGPQSQLSLLTGDAIRVVYAANRDDSTGARCALWVDVPAPFRVLSVAPDSITVMRNERAQTDSGT